MTTIPSPPINATPSGSPSQRPPTSRAETGLSATVGPPDPAPPWPNRETGSPGGGDRERDRSGGRHGEAGGRRPDRPVALQDPAAMAAGALILALALPFGGPLGPRLPRDAVGWSARSEERRVGKEC